MNKTTAAILEEEKLKSRPLYHLALLLAGVNGGYEMVSEELREQPSLGKTLEEFVDWCCQDTPENLLRANQAVVDHLTFFQRKGGIKAGQPTCLGMDFAGADPEQDHLVATDPGMALILNYVENC